MVEADNLYEGVFARVRRVPYQPVVGEDRVEGCCCCWEFVSFLYFVFDGGANFGDEPLRKRSSEAL